MLPYLNVVERRFVGDVVEQEQGCGERDGALVPVPWCQAGARPSRAHGSELALHCSPRQRTPRCRSRLGLKHRRGPCCKIQSNML